MPKQIYMDHSATTPVDPNVVEAMLPYWTNQYGNAASAHRHGRDARRGLEQARRTFADLLGAQPNEIFFTGSGSESDNLAIRGILSHEHKQFGKSHLITSITEHAAVLETGRQLAALHDFEITIVGVDKLGRVNPADVAAAIKPTTALISIMAANNEVGTLQPIHDIGALARERQVAFHTDAVQAAGYTAWNLADMPIDAMSLAAHKFYGPKGIGVLYIRNGVDVIPALTGGGQESGQRPGTVNVPLAVGAAKAFELAQSNRAERIEHSTRLRDKLIGGIVDRVGATGRLTGPPTERLPHHASFVFQHIPANDLIINLDMLGISAGSGSACATGNSDPSPTLLAMGYDATWANSGLRLTVGMQNSLEEVDRTITAVAESVNSLSRFRSAIGSVR